MTLVVNMALDDNKASLAKAFVDSNIFLGLAYIMLFIETMNYLKKYI